MKNHSLAALAACTIFWLLAACSSQAPQANPATAQPDAGEPVAVAASVADAALPTPCGDATARCAIDLSGSAFQSGDAQPASAAFSAAPQLGSAPRSAAVGNPIPREILRLLLVEGEGTLRDFRVDPASATAYLTDSNYRMLVVDTATGSLIAALETSGDRLLLDFANHRIYVMPDNPWADDGEPEITVVDTATHMVVGALTGSRVAVDPAHNRVYVGDLVSVFDTETPGVRLYDGATLDLIAQGEMAGDPLYNPLRDELIITNYSAFTADPDTLAVRADLAPDISAFEMRGCNGCVYVDESFYYPDEGLVSLNVSTLATGGGPGRFISPRFLDAATLQPASLPVEFSSTCSSKPVLHTLRDGAILDHELYVRYIVYNNLTLRDAAGNVLVFKDGLTDPFPNPNTGVGYVQDSFATSYVLDRGTLSPVGLIESLCFFAHDADSGLLYATDAARKSLVVLAETGGASSALPAEPHKLAGNSIDQIVLSPEFADDGTLFVVTWTEDYAGQVVARSTDGGATWTRLGGLPVGDDLRLFLAVSPTYAQDRTLLAGGYRRDAIGEGVWRSTDGGDTWLPQWVGLEALRVQRIVASPRFASDGAVLAYSAYNRITPWDHGYALSRSRDGGLTWTTVITASAMELLPGPSAYLPIPAAEESPIRQAAWWTDLMVRVNPSTWVTVTLPFANDEYVRATLAAPSDTVDRGAPDLFVVSNKGVYRSADTGATWMAWQDDRLAGRNYENDIRSAATTPRLADGSYRLLIGTGAGELWTLNPAEMAFGPSAAPTPTPVAPVTDTVGSAPTAVATPAAPVTATVPVTESSLATGASETSAPAAPLPAEPPAGLFVPEGAFAAMWANEPAMQQALGYARTKEPTVTPAAYQFFDRGVMVWRGDVARIYVILTADNAWQVYADTFAEGDAEYDPALRAPDNRYQPIRGFGKVWREHDDVRDAVGWASAEEEGLNGQVQEFERGLILRLGGLTYVLYATPDGNRLRP